MVLQNLGFSLEGDTAEESQSCGTFPTKTVSVQQSISLRFTAWPTRPPGTPKQLPQELPGMAFTLSAAMWASAGDQEGNC